jgi:hypothetical protein
MMSIRERIHLDRTIDLFLGIIPGIRGKPVCVHRAPHLLVVGHLKYNSTSARPTPSICLPRDMRSLFHRGGTL